MDQRYYDQGVGRFLSVDPVTANTSNGDGFNAYQYAANNPYRFLDPDGRKEEETKKLRPRDTRSVSLRERASKGRSSDSTTSTPKSGPTRHDQPGRPGPTGNYRHANVDHVDPNLWDRINAREGETIVVISKHGIIVEVGAVAGPLPTAQVGVWITQRPLDVDGSYSAVAADPAWFKPGFHSFNVGGWVSSKKMWVLPSTPSKGGNEWHITLQFGASTHDNLTNTFVRVYASRN